MKGQCFEQHAQAAVLFLPSSLSAVSHLPSLLPVLRRATTRAHIPTVLHRQLLLIDIIPAGTSFEYAAVPACSDPHGRWVDRAVATDLLVLLFKICDRPLGGNSSLVPEDEQAGVFQEVAIDVFEGAVGGLRN